MSKYKECYYIVKGTEGILEPLKFLELTNQILILLLKESYVVHIALGRKDGHHVFKSIFNDIYTESGRYYKELEIENFLMECDEVMILHNSKTIFAWKN